MPKRPNRHRNTPERAMQSLRGITLMILSIVAFIVLLWVVVTLVRVVVG